MKATPSELALIASALAAIEQVLASVGRDLPELPFFSASSLATLPHNAQEAAQREEEAFYRARPRESAIQLCLTSASALLYASQTLLNQSPNPSPQEQERQWKELIGHTKIAGRAAYRAALVLTDQQWGP